MGNYRNIFLVFFMLLLIIIFNILISSGKDSTYTPPNGYVPDKETALKIAEAIWLPMYGAMIYDEKPFKVELKKNIWIVRGTGPVNKKGELLYVGGRLYIEIRKSDCKIIKAYHEK